MISDKAQAEPLETFVHKLPTTREGCTDQRSDLSDKIRHPVALPREFGRQTLHHVGKLARSNVAAADEGIWPDFDKFLQAGVSGMLAAAPSTRAVVERWIVSEVAVLSADSLQNPVGADRRDKHTNGHRRLQSHQNAYFVAASPG